MLRRDPKPGFQWWQSLQGGRQLARLVPRRVRLLALLVTAALGQCQDSWKAGQAGLGHSTLPAGCAWHQSPPGRRHSLHGVRASASSSRLHTPGACTCGAQEAKSFHCAFRWEKCGPLWPGRHRPQSPVSPSRARWPWAPLANTPAPQRAAATTM